MVRKTNKTLKRAKKNLKTLAYRSKIGAKLAQLSTTNIFYNVREVNDIDQGKGRIQMASSSSTVNGVNVSTGSLPLCVVPLKNCINGGTAPAGVLMLDNACRNFHTICPYEYAGSTGNTVNEADTVQYKKMLLRYVDLRLMLWQNEVKNVSYKCYLVRIFDEDLSPLNDFNFPNPDSNLTAEQEIQVKKRRLFYYYHLLRAQLSSPLIETQESFLKPIKGKFKILWEKEYHIEEQHGQLETAKYQQVKFFKRFDEIVNFQSPDSYVNNPITPNGDASQETVKYITNAGNTNSVPQTKDNLFFIITSNCSFGEGESNTTDMDKITFDIAMKTKYTVPSGNKAFST